MVQSSFHLTLNSLQGNDAEIVMEPLVHGFGHTLGNSLRRVLLSSLPGYALTAVKIKGVDHAFSTLPGMKETVAEFLLNLKQVVLRSDFETPSTLRLQVNGDVVTAGNIECPTGVSVVNTDLVLAHLDSEGKLDATLRAEYGLGYSPTSERTAEDVSGELLLDALYSPIVKVAYSVEQTRVGQQTDFDKLILHIRTNGSVEALDAVRAASEVLIAHFQAVSNPESQAEPSTEAESVSKANVQLAEVQNLAFEEIGIPTRIANSLRKGGYLVVGDLAKASREQLTVVNNLGAKSLELVEKALQDQGVNFRS